MSNSNNKNSSSIQIKETSIRFVPDRGLMYLIQNVTQQPSDEILGFFYDFGKTAVFKVLASIEKRSQTSFKRTIENYYPKTAIPFMIKVEGYISKRDYSNNIRECTSATISATFPENTESIDTKEMMNLIIEKQLLGGSAIPNFEPPKAFASQGFKDLVKEILGEQK